MSKKIEKLDIFLESLENNKPMKEDIMSNELNENQTSPFTLRKVKNSLNKLQIFTFKDKYFERLKKIHPYAIQLIISSLIKFNKDSGKNISLNHEQYDELDKILKKYESSKKSSTRAQQLLNSSFVDGFRLLSFGIDDAPELLDEIFTIIYRNP